MTLGFQSVRHVARLAFAPTVACVLDAARSKLEQGDVGGCLADLAARRDALGEDEALTVLWLRALAAHPGHPGLAADVEQALRLPSVEVALRAAIALNAAAARRPLDAPPPEDGPAFAARALCEAVLHELEGREAGWFHWQRANALRQLGKDFDAEALEAYGRAANLLPQHGPIWFDLAVLHKWRGRWNEALGCALKARARAEGNGAAFERGVLWNAAIAATVLGDGDMAGGFWRDLGMPVRLGEGGMPVVEGAPDLQVRVPSRRSQYGLDDEPELGFELLWVAPTSPCHGVVISAAFREHPIDFGDVVVWDGTRVAAEANAPAVFPLLERLAPSKLLRMDFVAVTKPSVLHALKDALDAAGLEPSLFLQGAAPEKADEERFVRGKLITRPDAVAVHRVLHATQLKLAIPTLYEALGDTKRAGQEHQAWRGVVRVAEKRGLR